MKFLKSIYRKLQGVREKIRRQYYKEKRKSYGKENPEKTFYVIRRKDSYIGCGLFSHVITTVANIKFAIEKGYIPVVDMMDYPNLYISKKELHKVNAWEYFFEQPCGYDISDIKNSKNVILSDGGIMENRPDAIATDELECWKTVFDKYVLLKPQVRETMDTEWSSYVNANEKVLGVLCRGTDYTSNKPKNHPIQPDIDQIIDKIKNTFYESGGAKYTKIFLATEDIQIYRRLKKEFGEILFINNKEFVDYKEGKSIGVFETGRANDRYLRGLEYLTSIYMLSKCTGLIAGQCGGTTGAMLFNNKYEDLFIWDLGTY